MRYYVALAFAAASALAYPAQLETVAPSSPVEQRIRAAQRRVQADEESPQAFNDLAFAYCRAARDRGDLALYAQAQAALDRSLQLSPSGFEAEKLGVTVLLGRHEFARALERAAALNQKSHDDIGVWALLVDANVALGNYSEAERDAQWILDLRPGSSLGFEKAAGLRVWFGDPEGAVEFFDEARRRTSPNDRDQQAWLLTSAARLQLANPKRAAELLAQAQTLFPDSQFALQVLAELRMAQGDYPAAAALFETRYRNVKSASNLYDWAEALEKSGRHEQALAAFQTFEAQARAETGSPYNANRDLIFFYADRDHSPAEALALAAREAAARHDSPTLDAYAWALYINGRYAEAKTQMDRALAVGIRNPAMLDRAARIAAKAGDTAASNHTKEVAAQSIRQ